MSARSKTTRVRIALDLWILCDLDLGPGFCELCPGLLGIRLGSSLKDNLGERRGELLDLVDSDAGDVTDDLVDSDL